MKGLEASQGEGANTFPKPPLHRSDTATGGLRSDAEPETTCYYIAL